MKVLHVIASLSPVYGGPSVAAVEMCKSLRSEGIEAEIATTNAGGNQNDTIDDVKRRIGAEVPVHVFPRIRPYTYMTSPSLASWLRRSIREFDLVHVHALFLHPTSAACRYARKEGVPYLVRPLGLLDPWCLNQSRLRKSLYLALVDRRNLRHAAAIHFTTDHERDSAQGLPPGARKAVVPLGVTPPDHGPSRMGPSLREKWRVPRDFPLLLFLSRIEPKKGLDLLIPAAGRLKREGLNFFVAVAGPDLNGYSRRVQDLIQQNHVEDRFGLTGPLWDAKKWAALEEATALVLPSYQENFGIAVAEAMWAGTPVLVSDRVALHTEVRAHNAGWVCACNEFSVTDTLRDLLQDARETSKRGENARHAARQSFQWKTVALRLAELYRSLSPNLH